MCTIQPLYIHLQPTTLASAYFQDIVTQKKSCSPLKPPGRAAFQETPPLLQPHVPGLWTPGFLAIAITPQTYTRLCA